MTGDRGFERQLPDGLADLAMSSYPAYIDDVLAITARTRRRPAWQFPSRWLPIEPAPWVIGARARRVRRVAVLAMVLVLVAALVAVYIGSRTTRLPDPFGPAGNGQIVFSADHAAWVVLKDGSTRRLLDGEGDEVGMTYSLDGTRIAFGRVLNGKLYLWVANADGTQETQLLTEPLEELTGPVWSPDGRQIAIGPVIDGVSRVIIVEADGSGSRLLDLPFPARNPVWRPPDGRELAVRGEVDGHAQLFVVAADGSAAARAIGPPAEGLFVDDMWDHQGAQWSPDGSRLAYNSIDAAPGAHGYEPGVDHADDLRFQVHVIESDGSNTLLAGPDLNVMESWPSWSPDGTLIAIERWTWTARAWLAILPADGSGPGLDVDFTTPFRPDMGWTITWAPDGSRILGFYDTARGAVSIDVATGEYEDLDWPLTDRPDWQRIAP